SHLEVIPLIAKNQTTIMTRTVTSTQTTTNMNTTAQQVDKKKQVIPMNMNFTSTFNDTHNTNVFDQPKEAFVTFSNNQPSYLALLNVLLDSVHAFSTRPIIAFGIDVDLNIDTNKYPRVIKRRIAQSDCGPSVYFCKIHAIVSSNVEYGVLMETDDVVNYNVDVLFDVLHVWPYPLPLSPRHPDDPQNYDIYMKNHNVSKRTTPYIHAHIIWNYRAIPFLKKLHSLLRQGDFQGANFDETAVNVMLWKAGANHTLCKYDPYHTYGDAYIRWPTITNCSQYCHTAFITLHGCKEHQVSSDLLTTLKANAGKPVIQTFGMGGMKHINDKSATCCYPDSKTSPIHPLLCEHNLLK
ncbi:unnamed protein product, partial [Rotaria magnacalcarata]